MGLPVPDFKKIAIDNMRYKPVQCYIGGAIFLYGLRWYATETSYNYWFGKLEYQRRIERGELWAPNSRFYDWARIVLLRKSMIAPTNISIDFSQFMILLNSHTSIKIAI